jgi:hypothetical protein
VGEGLFHLVTMPGSRAIDENDVDRSRALYCIVYSHRFGELGLRRAMHKGVGHAMRSDHEHWQEVDFRRPQRWLWFREVYYSVVPILATLMAKDNVVARH